MREMKDSGVAWIGEIPETWETMLVKNVFEITRGRVIAKTEIEEEARENYYPVYSSQTANNGVLGYIQTFDYLVDSLTWTTDGAKAGTVFLRRGKYSITNVCGILTPKTSEQCLEFLHYTVSYSAFNCRRADINGYKIMSNEMAIIPIVLPPISTQQKIAAHLDRKCTQIDALISNAQQQIEKLKAYKQSVITETVTKGLNPDVQMKDSGVEWIGEIPEHWNSIQLKYIISLIESGVSVNAGAESAKENQFGVLKTSSVSKQVFIPTENKNVNEEEYSRVKCPVTHNTLIVSRMNTPDLVGACGYVDKDYPNLFLPDRLWQVHIKNMYVKYVWYYLISHNVRNYYASLASGTSSSMQNISQGQFESLIISVPSLDEQQAIADYLDRKCSQIDKLIALKQQKIEKLQQYKKSLIYEYVTGKKEV